MRPLERFTTIKAKVSFVIVFAVSMTVLLMLIVLRYVLARGAVPWWQLVLAGGASAVAGLGLARLLASGLTKPLRDMAAAAARLARGGEARPVTPSSNDEVGALASAFNEMLAKLEEQERMRRQLVANVSHELKTPLAALQAHLENLRDGIEHGSDEVLTLLLDQSRRLGRLVDQLLELSRLDAGDLPLERRRFALRPVVERVLGELAVMSDAADGPRVVNRVDQDVMVDGDEERLHQVVYNLVDNALRFSPARGRVEVRASVANGSVVMDVADDGPGIPKGDRERVFERFFRGDAARARSNGGTGIGLAIVRSIVEAHGGQVAVHDNGSGGATFRVTLPAEGERT